MYKFNRKITALAVAATLGASSTVFAAGNNDGSLTGQVLSTANTPIANAAITIKNINTGLERTITAGNDGSYRFGKLPVGTYSITVEKDGFETAEIESFAIQIGSSSANVSLSEVGYETIEVTGARISMVDVRSSESALNIGEMELDRIPVPRDVTSVALLAPGTTSGDGRFGNVASFGGSSVAENTMYINGLNVTNFRNGVGFSSVPFEFYKEFQVKTGGYSAEFGRSTGQGMIKL